MTGLRARVGALLLCVPVLVVAAAARAGSSVRYALIVGNNRADPGVVQIEPLQHAEEEAIRLAEKLIQFANFDHTRVETVVGKGLTDVLAAAHRLADQHEADRAELGPLPTLFALFFTGHGLSGKLLTANGAVTGEDLAKVVRDMDASLTLGFFDACYSGALDFDALRAKGVVVTPGFNPVAVLPKEILDSEGTMWFVSSKENEISYEDERLGGLFMHFFSEAFTAAPLDDVGIPLEAMWEYARRRTAATAAEHGRVQTPEKIVRALTARGPLYFSFPRERTAALRFDADVEGTFLIQYSQAGLAEKVTKTRGQELEAAAFEGEVVLSRLSGGGSSAPPTARFHLGRGDRVLVHAHHAELPAYPTGFWQSPIRAKGDLTDLSLTRSGPRTEVALGAGYRFSLAPEAALNTPHQGVIEASWFRGPLSFGLQLAAGATEASYETWSYRMQEVGLQASAGYGLDLSSLRLDFETAAGPSFVALRYGNRVSRRAVAGWLGAGTRLSVPIPFGKPLILIHARALAGVKLSQGIVAGDTATHASFAPVLEAGVSLPIAGWSDEE